MYHIGTYTDTFPSAPGLILCIERFFEGVKKIETLNPFSLI